ncbi:MAG: epoxyqueuosine reductase [Desulfobacterales bacterium]|nr:epoxyqueuosine reductase [Desulfobacterales bacterium]
MELKKVHAKYTEEFKARIRDFGADLVGIADVEPLKDLKMDPPDLLEPFVTAVTIAIKLPAAVFEQIVDRPTPIYKSVYTTANLILDQIAFRTAMVLQSDGFPSLPIPASQVLDKENWYAAISHKAVARMAGVGWQGKNLLLITPQYGSRVRLATLLTKAPLEVDGPIKNRCGNCTACQDACPAQAIRGLSTKTHYKSRNEAMHFSMCVEKVTGEFAKIPEVEAPICGICIKACPFGRKLHVAATVE